MLRRSILVLLLAIAALAALLAANTWRKPSRQLPVAAIQHVQVDRDAIAQRLASAVRMRTVSYDERPDASAEEFVKLRAFLQQAYPRAHQALQREVIGGHSLLYTWRGMDPAAKGIMFVAHQDVVPIAAGTEKDWSVDPFAGIVRDGFIWGRGAWDNKSNLLSMLEAIEALLAQGFQPARNVYLVAGHDEELGGENGALKIAEVLAQRKVRVEFVIDEGTLITEGVVNGLDKPVAMVGIAEKGIMTVALTAHDHPGHSSMPPRETAIGMLSEALARLERNPMPNAVAGVAAEMFDTLAPEMRLPNRLLLSNLWLFAPLVERELGKSRSSNAMTRTTAALTVVHAGNKVNVVPAQAEAFVNYRMLPGDSQEEVLRHTKDVVADPRVKVERSGFASEASRVSASGSNAFRLVGTTIREVFPGTVVTPGLMVGATDARHMEPLADHVFRFSPVRARDNDLLRFHGTNERISIDNYAEMIAFYHRLIAAATGQGASSGASQ
jgi:carboxypeptidase PM20D1